MHNNPPLPSKYNRYFGLPSNSTLLEELRGKAIDHSDILHKEIETNTGEKILELSYVDPRLHGYKIQVVADTVPVDSDPDMVDPLKFTGERVTTLIARFPRYVLSEMNTHRVFSRNSASSRARSVSVTFREALENPVIPVFTSNQKGMSGDPIPFMSERYAETLDTYLEALQGAVKGASKLLIGHEYREDLSLMENVEKYHKEWYLSGDIEKQASIPNVHKQVVNRLLEPFQWHEAIITSNEWVNFLNLRTDLSKADPAIFYIAKLIEEALKVSEPRVSAIHMPFMKEEDVAHLSAIVKFMGNNGYLDSGGLHVLQEYLGLGAADAARVSYQDRSNYDRYLSKNNLNLVKGLFGDRHMSPFEHIAIQRLDGYTKKLCPCGVYHLNKKSNLIGDKWASYRSFLEETEAGGQPNSVDDIMFEWVAEEKDIH